MLKVDYFSVVRQRFRRRKDGTIYPLERAVRPRRTILPYTRHDTEILSNGVNSFGGSNLSVEQAIRTAVDDDGPFVGSGLDDHVGDGLRHNHKDPGHVLYSLFEEQELYPAMLAHEQTMLAKWPGTDAVLPRIKEMD